MTWGLEFGANPWLAALAAVCAAAGAAHLWLGRSAEPLILVLRGAASASLVLAMLSPSLSVSEPVVVKPRLVVLVDSGHSMQAPSGERMTRLAAAVSWLSKSRKAVEKRSETAVFALSDRARQLPGMGSVGGLAPSDAGFHATDAFLDAADALGRKGDRAWLLTDGNAVQSDGLETALARLGAPVDVLGVGPARRGRGAAFLDLKTPDFVFLHGRFPIEAQVEASGLAGERVRLALLKEEAWRKDARSPEGAGGSSWKPVESRRFAVASDYEVLSASFTATAESLGRERYRLVASPEASGKGRSSPKAQAVLRSPEGASSKPLAAREVGVEVIRQKYRVMYLSGRPSYGYASLREFMKADPNHELVSFVILRNPESYSFVPDNELSLIPFPAEEIFVRNLSQFDLFILENFSYRRFNLPAAYLNGLKGFVAAGGALLVIGGEQAFGTGGYKGTPLEELLPVTLASSSEDYVRAKFSPRPASVSHPLLGIYESQAASLAAWQGLPPLFGYAKFGSVKEGVSVLLEHPNEKTQTGQGLPVMALKSYGRGKVLVISTDSTWRWRLGAASDWKLSSFYGRFWTRVVQYLTGSLDLSKVKFAPVPDRIAPREPAVFTLRVFDENFRPALAAGLDLSVVWTGPDGRSAGVWAREGEPGAFSVELTGLKEGVHRLRASVRLNGKPWGEDQVRFAWQPAGAEPPMDRAFLERVAKAGGGRFVPLKAASAEELLGSLPPVRRDSRVSRRYFPWTSPYWLGLSLGLFFAEWALRRSRGYR
ncbi:MAG: hypothetical protein HY748_10840 [Elusimicrobia bacterium]|nr:hypothetical protein [Elusimicrobiota bacterium]